jgi:hypothetical protein
LNEEWTAVPEPVNDLRPHLIQVLDALGEGVEGTGFLCHPEGFAKPPHVQRRFKRRRRVGWLGLDVLPLSRELFNSKIENRRLDVHDIRPELIGHSTRSELMLETSSLIPAFLSG